MAAGNEVKIGPWPKGINLLDQADQLEDQQLAECVNLDVDNTGILVPRRGVTPVQIKHTGAFTMAGTVTLKGEAAPRAAIFAYNAPNTIFAFYSNPDTGSSSAITGATQSGKYSAVVPYLDKLWYIPADAASQGKSSSAESATITTLTAVAAMPWGDQAIILKDRLFIVRKAENKIFYSKATDFTTWAEPDGGFVQVQPGDNQPITKVVSLNNQLVIFKRDQTYILSYTSNPKTDGVLRQVSADQGAIDAITFNNEIYTYNSRSVFKFVNGFFSDIGIQLDLPNRDNIDGSTAVEAKLTVIGKTLLFGKTPAGNTYAMNLDTGAWATYEFVDNVSFGGGSVFSRSSIGTAHFFGEGTTNMYYMAVKREMNRTTDAVAVGTVRCPAYRFKTKEFNFEDGEAWKRLFSWRLDATVVALGTAESETYVNGTKVSSSTDITDLIGSGSHVSTRFRGLALGVKALSRTATAMEAVGIKVEAIVAVVGARAPVSK